MAQFLGDIAFALWTVLFAGGLIAWHFGTEAGAQLIKTAAGVLVVVGLGGAVCTGYFWFKYNSAGEFDTAYAATMPMQGMPGSSMQQMRQMMMNGQMQMRGTGMEGRPGPGMMQRQMPTGEDSGETLTPEQREYLEDPGKHPM